MKIEVLISRSGADVIAAHSAGQDRPEQPGNRGGTAPQARRVCGIGPPAHREMTIPGPAAGTSQGIAGIRRGPSFGHENVKVSRTG